MPMYFFYVIYDKNGYGNFDIQTFLLAGFYSAKQITSQLTSVPQN
jgi:hypothetical protein